MRFFTDHAAWNWVDANNAYLGYETTGDCCATHGWFLTDEVPGEEEPGSEFEQPEFDWEPWSFDTTFEDRIDRGWMDAGGGAVFKIVNGEQVKYLTIYNSHNGYYGSGFDYKVEGVPARTEECL